MEMAVRINKRLNDADLAVHLLKENRNAMHYREIIDEVRKLRGLTEEVTPSEVAQILTQINIDSRFVHMGKGLWSLKDFSTAVSRTVDDENLFIDAFDDDDDVFDGDAADEVVEESEDEDDDSDVAEDIPAEESTEEDGLIEVVPLDDILAEEERDEDDDDEQPDSL